MPYTKLLNDIIDKSGLTLKEIAERCTKDGVKVTASYISTLKNDINNRTPSDEMSRAIARACNCKEEGILVLEAYLDNSPAEFKSIIAFLRSVVTFAVLGVFENTFSDEEYRKVLEIAENMPLSSMLLQMSNSNESVEKAFGMLNMTSTVQDIEKSIKVEATLKEAQGFPILDNSMFPLLSKDSKSIIEYKPILELSDGDIVAFSRKNKTELLYRKIAFLNEEHTKFMLFPINTEYETMTLTVDEVAIVGKVKQVITNL